jgi:hypothetical protein
LRAKRDQNAPASAGEAVPHEDSGLQDLLDEGRVAGYLSCGPVSECLGLRVFRIEPGAPVHALSARRIRTFNPPVISRGLDSRQKRQKYQEYRGSTTQQAIRKGQQPVLENLEHSVAPHFFVYNFITRHTTLRMPPALRAKVTDHKWEYEELVELIDRAS